MAADSSQPDPYCGILGAEPRESLNRDYSEEEGEAGRGSEGILEPYKDGVRTPSVGPEPV